MTSVLALTWFSHRRTTELCAGLGIELVELTTHRTGAWRYLLLAWRTVLLLQRRRPRSLLVQNPSLVLAVWVLLLRPLFRYRVTVDAHNEAVEPYVNRSRWVRGLTRCVLRYADLTIVTNKPLGDIVEKHGGRYFVLPDRIPTPPETEVTELAPGFNLAVIATFAPDEPIAQVLQAVDGLDVNVFVTGNFAKLDPQILANTPANARFTGFLDEREYWRLLRSVNAIVDLTEMDNCLVCGGYEAVAVGKPVLLSASAASKELFYGCGLFTSNAPDRIREGILLLRQQHELIARNLPAHRARMRAEWDVRAAQLRRFLALDSSETLTETEAEQAGTE